MQRHMGLVFFSQENESRLGIIPVFQQRPSIDLHLPIFKKNNDNFLHRNRWMGNASPIQSSSVIGKNNQIAFLRIRNELFFQLIIIF